MTAIDGRTPLASLARSLADAAVVVDRDGRVLAWNTAAGTRLGLSGGMAGRSLAALGIADLQGATRLPLSEGSADEPAAAILVWPDALTGPALPAADPDQARQKALALGRLAPGVTHDMRNHVSGFKAFAALLRADRSLLSEEDEALLGDLDANADRVTELFEAFTLLARDREPSRRTMLLVSAVNGALALAAYQMINVRRTVSIPADLPELAADRLRLHQALVALVVNELDAFPPHDPRGTLDVRARILPGAGPAVVELVFEDDAPTVPHADRAALFDPRPPAGSARRAGLDLAVARRLIEADGGTLRYEPGAVGGNRLVVTLATVRAAGADDVAEPGDAGAGTGDATSTTGNPGHAPGGLTMLVCDDEAVIRDLLARSLGRLNYRVVQVASAAEALEAIEREPVDVVMTDYRLTGMSGLRLHAEVARRDPALARRFILMSGNAGDDELQAFASETGLPVLWKPFSLNELDAVIRMLAAG